ncbi:unnamed protein product [Cylindrotheca closterium]|uniref:Cyclin-D1-binding protein 1-like N-terminal domain-containing protein n=1 Tax=Cylindrotheca closterium TaxID=2856 RepID=A0AAD2CDD0_9STRA|nr:unnamed protein product [Cylindrotheca closterium]
MASKSQSEQRKPTNAQVIAALDRLIDHLKTNPNASKSAPILSHFREIPKDVQIAYNLLHEGAALVHATSTKYTLVGKISIEDQKILSADLQRGCEVLGAATHSLLQDCTGCSRSVRQATRKASLAICINVKHLMDSFEDESALPRDNNIGAQKTGAVWDACDKILNKQVPQGNRNAMRREFFTWTQECQDTMEEFQETIDMGPVEGDGDVDEAEADDYFGGDEEDQYSESELPIALACMGILKCSRGTMKATLEASDVLGKRVTETQDEQEFDHILKLYNYARAVGEGATDFGSVMYPPMLASPDKLEEQLRRQAEAIIELLEFLLGINNMPSSVTLLATKIKNAANSRQKEALEAITQALK